MDHQDTTETRRGKNLQVTIKNAIGDIHQAIVVPLVQVLQNQNLLLTKEEEMKKNLKIKRLRR